MEVLLYIVAVLLMVAFIFYVITEYKGLSTGSSIDKSLVTKKWNEIEKALMGDRVSDLNGAVLEADKLLDYVLKAVTKNKTGTMGDRLKLAKDKFSKYEIYQGLWEAHKLRNRIAHEVSAEILSLESKRAIEKFKKGLKDLKVL